MNVTRFPMGTTIPEWLLTLEPAGPGARKENFRFSIDVDVIETEDHFVVMPAVYGYYVSIIDMSGVFNCKMLAPGKIVRVATTLTDVFAEGRVPLVQMPPQAPTPEPRPQHELMQEIQRPAPTFWQRVRYAFTGR